MRSGRSRRDEKKAAAGTGSSGLGALADIPGEQSPETATSQSQQQPTSLGRRQSTNDGHVSDSASRPKRQQIATACSSCRSSKLKCSGKHPTCERCAARGLECSYDVNEEGVTRREHFRRQYAERCRQYEEQRDALGRAHAVLGYLQGGSDSEAAECLARLRIGYSINEVYDSLGTDVSGLNTRPMSPEAARVAAQFSSALPQLQTGSRDNVGLVDGDSFENAPMLMDPSSLAALPGPSSRSSAHSLDDDYFASASDEYPHTVWSDNLDPALQ